MKKTILVVLTFCISIYFCFNTVSAEESNNVFVYDNKEIIIDGEIGYQTMKKIADFVAGESIHSEGISTCALDCSLGHSIVSGVTAIEVEHNVYEAYFKCVESIYDVQYCSRPSCDYFVKTLLTRNRISSCHG